MISPKLRKKAHDRIQKIFGDIPLKIVISTTSVTDEWADVKVYDLEGEFLIDMRVEL